MDLNFTIKTYDDLDFETKKILVEIYHSYYEGVYGIDAFDAFLKVTNLKADYYKNKIDLINEYTNNYQRALNAFNDDTTLILIYKDNHLLGASRIIKNRVLDVVFYELNKEEKRRYWQEVIIYIEGFLRKKKFKKMYIEIPLKEGPLLVRANELGFVEDVDDIAGFEEVTYTLNKDLV